MTGATMSIETASKPHWGDGRVAFIAYQEKISAALAAGRSMQSVFNELENNLGGLSYWGFRYHVKQRLKDIPKSQAPKTLTQISERKTEPSPPTKPKGFVLNLDPHRKFE